MPQSSWGLGSSDLENWPRGSENLPDHLPCRMTKGLIVYTGTPSRFPVLPSVLACSLFTAAAITTSPANSEGGEAGQLTFLTVKAGTHSSPRFKKAPAAGLQLYSKAEREIGADIAKNVDLLRAG